jgi:hypothetical protein
MRLDLERDLNEARDMANGLADYVRGDQLYGSVGGGLFGSGNKPALTVGALLLRLRRLRQPCQADHRRERDALPPL